MTQKMIARFALTVGSLTLAGGALASDCSSASQGWYSEGLYHAECNPAVNGPVISGVGLNHMNVIGQVLSQRNLGMLGDGPLAAAQGIKGMSAGAAGPSLNVWGNVNYNDLDFSSTQKNTNLGYSGETLGAFVGADYRLSSAMTVGVSLGLDNSKVTPDKTTVNVKNAGYTIAPYAAYQLSKNLSVDASLGWGQGSLKRSGGIPLPYDGDTERMFGGVNLNYAHWMGNLQLAAKASVFYSDQHNDSSSNKALAEATKYMAQGRVGAQLGYWVGNGLMPYLGVTYVNDFARNSTAGYNIDRDGFLIAAGLNYLSKGPVSAGISYTSEVGRDHLTSDVFMANVNIRF